MNTLKSNIKFHDKNGDHIFETAPSMISQNSENIENVFNNGGYAVIKECEVKDLWLFMSLIRDNGINADIESFDQTNAVAVAMARELVLAIITKQGVAGNGSDTVKSINLVSAKFRKLRNFLEDNNIL